MPTSATYIQQYLACTQASSACSSGSDTGLPTSLSWVLQPSHPQRLLSMALALFTLGCSGSGGPPLTASQPKGCLYTVMSHTFTTHFKHNPG